MERLESLLQQILDNQEKFKEEIEEMRTNIANVRNEEHTAVVSLKEEITARFSDLKTNLKSDITSITTSQQRFEEKLDDLLEELDDFLEEEEPFCIDDFIAELAEIDPKAAQKLYEITLQKDIYYLKQFLNQHGLTFDDKGFHTIVIM